MRAWTGWLIALLVLVLIGLIRVGVHVLYEDKKLRLELIISKFKLVLICKDEQEKPCKPSKPKKEKQKKKKQPKEKKKTADAAPDKKKTSILKNPWVQAVLEYWREILSIIGRVLTMPTLDVLRLKILVGGGDAEKCAMTYGKICAIIGGVLPVVENTFGIRKRMIDVLCCYDRDDLYITAETSITVRIYEVFALVFALLGLGIKILVKALKLKKAVQVYESSSP